MKYCVNHFGILAILFFIFPSQIVLQQLPTQAIHEGFFTHEVTPQIYAQLQPDKNNIIDLRGSCILNQQLELSRKNYLLEGYIYGVISGIFLTLIMIYCLKNKDKIRIRNIRKEENDEKNDEKNDVAIIRCMIVGDPEVGKTCILQRFCSQVFDQQYIPTIGANFKLKVLQNKKIYIWDTAGQQKYKISSFSYITGIKIFYAVYDCQNRSTFEKIPDLLEELKQNHQSFSSAHLCIVGNKIDSDKRQVSQQQGRQLALNNHAEFFQVSAKNGQNIKALFQNAPAWLKGNYEKNKNI